MAKIKLISDSACDITKQQELDGDIRILNFKVIVGEESYTSRVDFDNEGFYKILDGYDGVPATSQVTAFEFEETYEQYYSEGYDAVIYVSINRKGSATHDNAVMASKTFFENHPDAEGKFRIEVIDSRSYNCAYGYPVTQAAQMIKNGASCDEVVNYLRNYLDSAMIYFAPYTLKYAKKSGRIPSAAAFVGEMLGLKPIMKIYDGEITTYDKVRGDKAIIPNIIAHTKKCMVPGTPYCVIYGADEAVKEEMVERCTKEFGYPPAMCSQIGAAIAINAGPVVSGIMFTKTDDIS